MQVQLQDYDDQQRHLRQISGQDGAPDFGALTRPNLRRHDAGVGGSMDDDDEEEGEEEYLSQFSNHLDGRTSHISQANSENKVRQTLSVNGTPNASFFIYRTMFLLVTELPDGSRWCYTCILPSLLVSFLFRLPRPT